MSHGYCDLCRDRRGQSSIGLCYPTQRRAMVSTTDATSLDELVNRLQALSPELTVLEAIGGRARVRTALMLRCLWLPSYKRHHRHLVTAVVHCAQALEYGRDRRYAQIAHILNAIIR